MSASSSDGGQGTFTGRHMLIITVSAFAVIITVNLIMAALATGTFPGLIAKNGYVASQAFNERQAAARTRAALGWSSTLKLNERALELDVLDAGGQPIRGLTVNARIGRPANADDDRFFVLESRDQGYATDVALAPGRWQVVVEGRDHEGTLVLALSDDFFLRQP